MDSTIQTRLEDLLRQYQLLMPASSQHDSSSELQRVYNAICKLVFDEQAYQWPWDEPILSQLNWLFQVRPPEPTLFGQQVAEIGQRAQQVQCVNDFFFRVLNRDASVKEVYEALAVLSPTEANLLYRLESSNRLETIREADHPPSEKISAPSLCLEFFPLFPFLLYLYNTL